MKTGVANGGRVVHKFWRWLIGDWWVTVRCKWPHRTGYATYNKFRNTVLDTGLTKNMADEICNELNGRCLKKKRGKK